MVYQNRQSNSRGRGYAALFLAGASAFGQGCASLGNVEGPAFPGAEVAQVEEAGRRESSLNSERSPAEPAQARPEYRAVRGGDLVIDYQFDGKRILAAQERGELTEEQAAEKLQALDAKYKWENLREVKETADKFNEYRELDNKLFEEQGADALYNVLEKEFNVDSEGNVVLQLEEGKEYRYAPARDLLIAYRVEGRRIARAQEDGEISEEQALERLGALDAKYKWNEALNRVLEAREKLDKLYELSDQLREQHQVSSLLAALEKEFNVDAEGNVVGPVAQAAEGEQPAQPTEGALPEPIKAGPELPVPPPVRPPLDPPVLPEPRGMSIDDVAPPAPRESQWNKFWNGAGEVLDINGHLLGVFDYTLGQLDWARDGNRTHLREAYRQQPLQWRVAENTPWYILGEREFERWAVRENKIGSSKGLWGFSDGGKPVAPAAQPGPSQFSNSDPTSDPNNQITIPDPNNPNQTVTGPGFGRAPGK